MHSDWLLRTHLSLNATHTTILFIENSRRWTWFKWENEYKHALSITIATTISLTAKKIATLLANEISVRRTYEGESFDMMIEARKLNIRKLLHSVVFPNIVWRYRWFVHFFEFVLCHLSHWLPHAQIKYIYKQNIHWPNTRNAILFAVDMSYHFRFLWRHFG